MKSSEEEHQNKEGLEEVVGQYIQTKPQSKRRE